MPKITFVYTGSDQTFQVPAGITSLSVKLWGAGGGGGGMHPSSGDGGGAGAAYGDIAVTPGEFLTIIVGGRGRNNATGVQNPPTYGGGGRGWGGGNQNAGSGGGRSAIRRSTTELVTAGGGGGGGSVGSYGGVGGGTSGGNPQAGSATGGSQVAGGIAGGGSGATAGSAFTGGAGGGEDGSGGGGGGGYYGGGGGTGNGSSGLGGGGGSGYIDGATNAGMYSGTLKLAGMNADEDYDGYGVGATKLVDNATDGGIVIFHEGSDAYVTMPMPTVTAGDVPASANVSIVAPSAYARMYFGAAIAVVAPAMLADAYGPGFVAVDMPMPMVNINGHDATGERSFAYTMVKPALLAFGGANADLTTEAAQITITGTFAGVGYADLVAPSAVVESSVTVSAVGSSSLGMPSPDVSGHFGAVISAEIGGRFIVSAESTTGSVGNAVIQLPLFELSATATAQNYGSALLVCPVPKLVPGAVAWLLAPGAQLTAIGSATVAVTYEAYALNLKHKAEVADEMTRYTNYPFDRIVRYKNSYYGMNSTGLYLLEGATDFAEPTPTLVAWSYRTAMTDFESAHLKNIRMAYFGGRMAPAATVTVYAGETAPVAYAYTTPRDQTAQNYRQPLGRGLRARYYAIGAQGAGELTLDSLTIDVAALARKV